MWKILWGAGGMNVGLVLSRGLFERSKEKL